MLMQRQNEKNEKIAYLEAITTCVGLSGVFKKVINSNIQHFDRWVVITISSDFITQRLCKNIGVECIISNKSGLPTSFKKGCLINDGLKHLEKKDWILQIDCDILLPPSFRKRLTELELDKKAIYGCHRLFRLDSRLDSEALHFDEAFPKESFISKHYRKTELYKYNILGYFQLYNYPKRKHIYPENSNSCADDDLEFMRKWHRRNRKWLPFEVTHYGIPFYTRKWEGKTIRKRIQHAHL